MNGPVGGTIFLKANGARLQAKGNFQYRRPSVVRETVIGADGPHGYKIQHQAGRIEGEITLDGSLTLAQLQAQTDVTISLETARGDVLTLTGAYFVGEAMANTEEGNVAVAWESSQGELVPAS